MSFPAPTARTTALITGASSGIGREFARLLARRGYSLALVARRSERLESLAAELADSDGTKAHCLPADLTDPGQRERLAADLHELGLTVELLVNCAGFGIYTPFAASERERELEQIHLLVEAVVDLNSRFLPPMLARGSGAVINVASTAGFQPLPGNGTYSASKAFLLTHSEALGEELRGTGVSVTAICPGPVPTEFFEVSKPLVVHRIPRLFWCSASRVAADGLSAAERGKPSVVPGSLAVRLFYNPYRIAPRWIARPIARWLMAGELHRMREAGESEQQEPELVIDR